MIKKWIVREPISENANKELEDYSSIIKPLLFYRGVDNKEKAEEFLNPDYKKNLLDPFSMLNMEKVAERILLAIKNSERIVVFSDYDADGVSSAAIFFEFFRKIGFENYHIHIGARKTDGYGLTMNVVDEFIEQKSTLVITLDCGVTDREEIKKLSDAKIDVIVIDHHLVPDELPPAYAIIDNKQKDDPYPFKGLCGASTTFKTIEALIRRGDFKITEGWEKWLLDLVALATIADMMPLTGENRVLTSYGLQVFKKTRRAGLLALAKRAGLNLKDITEDDISFTIAPRINISSRMGHASASFDLLTTESYEEGDWISGKLEVMKGDRVEAVDEILEGADKKFKSEETLPGVLVLGNEKWNPGVLGLAAVRIMEKFKKTAFVWGKGESVEVKSSGRSDGTVNLVELMRNVKKGVINDVGGHAMAAGFATTIEQIGNLEREINAAYEKMPKTESELNNVYIDEEINLDDVNWENFKEMDKLAPFGVGNPKPNFLFKGVVVSGVKKFGSTKVHLQLDFKNSKNKTISAIGFFIGADENFNVIAGQTIDLVANIEKNTFRSANELRLRIVDINIC